jgi:hypothetical protein
MKQGSFRAVRLAVFMLVMISMAVFSAFADENTTDFESIVLESFDGQMSHSWEFAGKSYSYDFEWAIDASKFATTIGDDIYPKMSYVASWPMAVFGVNREGRDIRSLGLWGKFDRRGYNWIDVYPIVPGSGSDGEEPEPFEIPIPGRISSLDMWVWGSNLNYYIEVYFRDHQGVIHSLRLGSLTYQGWKNLRVRIPTNIPQSKRVLPSLASLSFVKFRIWTTPVERVDNFYVYFKQLKIITDIFESLFDGDELVDPERVQQLWVNNQFN